MARLRGAIEDILNRVKAACPSFQTVRVWNNQLGNETAGNYPAVLKPACFVEFTADGWLALGDGYSGAESVVMFHIIHEYYDDSQGNFEQDLPVFDLRDEIIAAFTKYKAVGCSPFQKAVEMQDTDHTNLYHYMVGFVTLLVDDAGVVETITPLAPPQIEITSEFDEPNNYIIPQ